MQLHKRDVLAKAMEILDNYGIADLSMRRLARELGVSPGALYWHFANKQELLGAVADEVLARVAVNSEGSPWQDRVRAVSARLRDALLSRTDGAELVAASFAAGQSTAINGIVTELANATGQAGVPGSQAGLSARTVVHYVLGFVMDEQSRLQWDAAGALAPGASVLETDRDASAAFDFGLTLLIDGIAARRGTVPAAG